MMLVDDATSPRDAAQGISPLTPLITASIAFALISCGVLFGAWLRKSLPEAHLDADAKDIVRLGTGLLATLAALVLGLLITSAKSSYDTQRSQIRQMTANILFLDRLLMDYGPEAQESRVLLRRVVEPLIHRLWNESQAGHLEAAPFEPIPDAERVIAKIFALSPANDAQTSVKAKAVQATSEIAQLRLTQLQLASDTIPGPFLAILVFWLTIIFASFSLFSRLNLTVIAVLIVFALSASTALFLILEMDNPFTGLMQISSAPLRNALAPLSQ